jgi:hypothetical protein
MVGCDISEYYIVSKWDNSWIQLSDDKLKQIKDKLVLILEDSKQKLYDVEDDQQKFKVLYTEPAYVGYMNRVMDCFSYKVEVKINNQYVPARNHQIEALKQFVETSDSEIIVSHPLGGLFKATFSKLEGDEYQYVTEDGIVIPMKRTLII